MTQSHRIAVDDLALNHAYIVYPGRDSRSLDPRVDVVSIAGCRNIFVEAS